MTPSKEQVTIGRLRKKIEKLKQQRDDAREKLSYYQNVLSMQPYLARRYEDYLERKTVRELAKTNAARVVEQQLLIEKLLKGN